MKINQVNDNKGSKVRFWNKLNETSHRSKVYKALTFLRMICLMSMKIKMCFSLEKVPPGILGFR